MKDKVRKTIGDFGVNTTFKSKGYGGSPTIQNLPVILKTGTANFAGKYRF